MLHPHSHKKKLLEVMVRQAYTLIIYYFLYTNFTSIRLGKKLGMGGMIC